MTGPPSRRRARSTILLLAVAFLVGGAVACRGEAAVSTAGSAAPQSPPVSAVPGTAEAAGPIPAAPLISRGRPVTAAPGVDQPGGVADGHYCTYPAWRATSFPSWLAIDVGVGPSELLLSWNSGYTGDYTGDGSHPTYGIPAAYTIQVSSDSTNGADGAWETVVDVHDNRERTREHLIPFANRGWVKMTVSGVIPGTVEDRLAIDEIDLHDASKGTADSVFFMGDSITAAAYLRCDDVQPSFAQDVHQALPGHFPLMVDGGVGGVNSAYGDGVIDAWLADNPDLRVWAIGYGTNDAWQSVAPDTFESQLQTIVDRVKAAGRQPVLARIPYALKGPADANVQALNRVIDTLTARNHLTPGPDLYAWFRVHPDQLGTDGVHPTPAGSIAINRLWAEALLPGYRAATGTPAAQGSPPSATGNPAVAAAPASNGVAWNGSTRFLVGVNYPWRSYGNDFGRNAWGSYGVHDPKTYAAVDADFASMAAMGIQVVRWFVFADGRAGITFDPSGLPTGLDDAVFPDLDAALAIARRHHIGLDLVLLDYMFMQDARVDHGVQLGGHAAVIDRAAGQQALVDRVFTPLFERYGDNPSILSWEVMNEPEWALSDGGDPAASVSQPSTLANFRTFTRRVVDAVHRLTKSDATVGSADVKWLRDWQGLGLDYYQAHYYDWMASSSSDNLVKLPYAALRIDRPLIVGEFPAAGSKTASLAQYLDAFSSHGYAGAWAWSYGGVDANGRPDPTVLRAWSVAHAGGG
ncbi:MAG TPA: GDSL-type esterase/lipase family protein [Thermomicrobiaceae bacterium]|nr:GDSL-type esterase/lipase family protein [Thermomicrobiaceae bacterium]